MKKLMLFVLLAALSATTVGQQKVHKTFSGDYYLKKSDMMGKATYSYYENERGDWVKDGKFTLTVNASMTNLVGTTSSIKTVINGNYKDGLMDGAWSWDVSAVDFPDNSNVCTTATKKMNGSFSQGLPHGTWTFSAPVQKKRRILIKTYMPKTYKFGEFYTADNASGNCRITFDHGRVVGTVQSNYMGSASGSYKAADCPEGKWVCTAINGIETEATFENGYLTMMLERRSGSVIARSEWDDDVTQMVHKVARGEVKEDELVGYISKEFKMSTIYDVDLALYDASFYRKDLEGDNTPDYGEIYGNYKQILKIKYEDWDGPYGIKSKIDYARRNYSYQSQIEQYNEYLESIYVHPDNKAEIRELVAECEAEIALYPQKKEMQQNYTDSLDICSADDFLGSDDYPRLLSENANAREAYKLLKSNIDSYRRAVGSDIGRMKPSDLSDDKIERMSYDSIKEIYDGLMAKIREAVVQREKMLATEDALNSFIEFENGNTSTSTVTTIVLPDFKKVKESGILPYFNTALGYLNSNNAAIDDYIELIGNAVKIDGNDANIQKRFKAVRKSPTAIIDLINSYK